MCGVDEKANSFQDASLLWLGRAASGLTAAAKASESFEVISEQNSEHGTGFFALLQASDPLMAQP